MSGLQSFMLTIADVVDIDNLYGGTTKGDLAGFFTPKQKSKSSWK